MQTEQADRLLKTAEVAARLRVNEDTVRRWLRLGKLRGVAISRSGGWRVPASEIERFLTLPEPSTATEE